MEAISQRMHYTIEDMNTRFRSDRLVIPIACVTEHPATGLNKIFSTFVGIWSKQFLRGNGF